MWVHFIYIEFQPPAFCYFQILNTNQFSTQCNSFTSFWNIGLVVHASLRRLLFWMYLTAYFLIWCRVYICLWLFLSRLTGQPMPFFLFRPLKIHILYDGGGNDSLHLIGQIIGYIVTFEPCLMAFCQCSFTTGCFIFNIIPMSSSVLSVNNL